MYNNKINLQIEGLRAIGLIMVLLCHFYLGDLPENMRSPLFFMREWGLVAVGLFFIISGFFLFHSEKEKKLILFSICWISEGSRARLYYKNSLFSSILCFIPCFFHSIFQLDSIQ